MRGSITLATGLRTRQWLIEHRANIDAVVCSDIEVAAIVGVASDLPPLWLLEGPDVDEAASAPTIEPDEEPGCAVAVVARRMRDDALRKRADQVVNLDEPVSTALEARGPAETVVLADCIVGDRSGAAEAGIRWFADEVMPELRRTRPGLRLVIAALDGTITRRALAADELYGAGRRLVGDRSGRRCRGVPENGVPPSRLAARTRSSLGSRPY